MVKRRTVGSNKWFKKQPIKLRRAEIYLLPKQHWYEVKTERKDYVRTNNQEN